MNRSTRAACIAGTAMFLVISCTFAENMVMIPDRRPPASVSGDDSVHAAQEHDVPNHAEHGLIAASDAALAEIRTRLVEGADSLIGKQRLEVRGRTFNYDCTGTVLAIYYHAGIDLSVRFGSYTGNGVNRLYRTLEDERLIYTTQTPVAGDLVFWDDTYDKNGDGRWNDPLTHVGMVTEVAEDGTISYVHLNYRSGITVEYMNLFDTETHKATVDGRDVLLNSPMRMRGARQTPRDRWLASQLYRSFGMGYRFGG